MNESVSIDMRAIREATAMVRANSIAICRACLAAGRFDLAAGYVGEGISVDVVQQRLAALAPAPPAAAAPAVDPMVFDPAAIERMLRAERGNDNSPNSQAPTQTAPSATDAANLRLAADAARQTGRFRI